MSVDLPGALLLGGALAMICALMGAAIGNATSSATRFHPGRLRRWLRRLALVAVASVPAALASIALPLLSLTTSAAIWLVALTAFGLGYRFASSRRLLRALDSGIAVGLPCPGA